MGNFHKSPRKLRSNGRSPSKSEQRLILTYEMLKHKNFRCLSSSSVKVLLELGSKHTGFNNGQIACSCEQLATALHSFKSTAARSLKELQTRGFIVCTRRGYFTNRQASLWEITFLFAEGYIQTNLWKDDPKPGVRPHRRKIQKDTFNELMESAEVQKC